MSYQNQKLAGQAPQMLYIESKQYPATLQILWLRMKIEIRQLPADPGGHRILFQAPALHQMLEYSIDP